MMSREPTKVDESTLSVEVALEHADSALGVEVALEYANGTPFANIWLAEKFEEYPLLIEWSGRLFELHYPSVRDVLAVYREREVYKAVSEGCGSPRACRA